MCLKHLGKLTKYDYYINKSKDSVLIIRRSGTFLPTPGHFRVKTKSPVKIFQIIFNEWFMKFGIPSQIISPKHNTHAISDNGNEFTTSSIKALYNLANVKMITTSYYKPNSNDNLELYNKTILRILRKFTSKDPTTWSKFIPLVQYV